MTTQFIGLIFYWCFLSVFFWHFAALYFWPASADRREWHILEMRAIKTM